MDKRILAAMCDPDRVRAGGGDGVGQLVPVGMVGDHQRQFHPALLGALLYCHPAGGLTDHRVGQAARPAVTKCRWWGDDDMSGKGCLVAVEGFLQIAEIDPLAGIIGAQFFLRAMKENRRVMSGLADQPDHPLRLAKRIGTDDMAAFRLCLYRGQKTRNFLSRVRMLEDRQPEGCLGDEQIAGNKLEILGRTVGMCLVIAGDDGDPAPIGQPDLRAAKDMAGRK